jgi:pimeloyl-ACP methyl ester carboxylesterase
MDHYAADAAAVTEHLDLRNAVHIGHSTGGGEVTRYVARHGKGRVAKAVLMSAVPLRARLGETPHTWVEWGCSQLLQNTPLHPISEWGRMRFGGTDVPAEQRLADLENSLAQVELDPAENVPLLAPLLDIPLPQERTPTLPPEELRRPRD